MTLSANQKKLRLRLLSIIHSARASHIGSCLSVIDIIDAVYTQKKDVEKFILSSGHSAAALYIVLEKYKYLLSANLIDFGVHPDRSIQNGIDLSTGSLGQGLPIALGMALASPHKNIYCLISDGECAEGSIWEALRVISDQKILNIKIIVSANGWGAYGKISTLVLKKRLKGFGFKLTKVDGHNSKHLLRALKRKNKTPRIIFAKTVSSQLPFLQGQDAHYYTMTENDYLLAKKILS